jgi:hypothetical protein
MTAVQLWTHDCRRPFPDPASVSLRLPPSEWTATGCWRDRSRALAIDGEEPLTAATQRCTRRGCSANPNVRMPRRTGTGSPECARVHTAIAQRAYDHHVGRPPATDPRASFQKEVRAERTCHRRGDESVRGRAKGLGAAGGARVRVISKGKDVRVPAETLLTSIRPRVFRPNDKR